MQHSIAIGEAKYLLTPRAGNAEKISRLTSAPDAPVVQNLMKTSELWQRIQRALREEFDDV